jgi:hypothetical protein
MFRVAIRDNETSLILEAFLPRSLIALQRVGGTSLRNYVRLVVSEASTGHTLGPGQEFDSDSLCLTVDRAQLGDVMEFWPRSLSMVFIARNFVRPPARQESEGQTFPVT